MVCLIVKERYSNQEPYSEISRANPAFLLSCVQAPVSLERCRKKTPLPLKILGFFLEPQ